MAVLHKLITLVVTSQVSTLFQVFTATFLLVAYPYLVRKAAEITAGGYWCEDILGIYSILDTFTKISLGTWPSEITHDISLCTAGKLITPVVIATGQLFNFLGFYQQPSSGVPLLNREVRAPAKISAGVWVAPSTNFTQWVTSPSTNYSCKDI